jgi:ABC-type transport system involved in multi-copper enzyme maturation permease subunit
MTLFGPVFYFDLIRESRRRPAPLLRLLYLLALFGMLVLAYSSWSSNFKGGTLPQGQTARFIESFFAIFLGAQFFLVVVLTPALTAGALTEEKEGQTLPFLLASNLHNHEIVLGKLGSRLVSVLLIVLAGLPVFSLLQLLGGVDPGWLIAGFAATGVTLLSLASVSLAWSAILPRSRDAVLFAYLSLPAYIVLARASKLLLDIPGAASFPSAENWESPITLQDVLLAVNAGDPFRALGRGMDTIRFGAREGVWDVLRDYALFHGVVILLGLLTAMLRVRRAMLAEGNVQRKHLALRHRLLFGGRPAIKDQPVLWREIYSARGNRLHWLARIVLFALVALSFLPPIFIYANSSDALFFGREFQSWMMNMWVRTVGTLVATLLLLAVAIRAATSIGSERQKQTFDVLLTTPLELEDILYGKWMGSLLSVGWGWVWLGAILGLGVISGGLSLLALPFMALCWSSYAAAAATLGLWFSVEARTPLRAIVLTVMTLLGLWIGPWLVLFCCGVTGAFDSGGEGVLKFLAGMSPPIALGMVSFKGEEFAPENNAWIIGYPLLGMVVWIIFSIIVWSATRQLFHVLTGRSAAR